MKRVLLLCSTIILWAAGWLSVPLDAKTTREHTKTIEETFPLEEGGEVNIVSMHGRIEVATWDRPEVKIQVTISTRAKNDRKGRETLKRIDVDFSSASSYVRAETEIKTQKSMWWFIQDVLGEADIQIDYDIFMPATANLDIEHRYGKVDIQNIDADVTIDLRHGDLEIDEVTGKVRLNLTHGDGVIAKANASEIDLSYYKLRMNDANSVEVDASFSRLNLSSANELRARSGNTKYFLGDIGKVDLENKYGTIEIDELEEGLIDASRCDVDIDVLLTDLEIDIQSADFHVERTDPSLKRLAIEGKNAGISVDLEDLTSFRLSIDADYTTVDLPDDLTIMVETDYDNQFRAEAYRSDKSSASRIEVISEHGGLKIR
ncbi:MAG: hypothetical protein KTR24_14985 [Saprospiraceae bacterium]|nr:hypothetical protein [Saprospiraceae bacterium]